LEGKRLGPGEGGIDLRAWCGALALYIERIDDQGREKFIKCPGPTHVLQANDWVYLLKDLEQDPIHEDGSVLLNISPEGIRQSIMQSDEGVTNTLDYFQFCPEFDQFKFPDNCDNAVLGPEKFAKTGQKALNLRPNFEINLVGVKRGNDLITNGKMGPAFAIQKGDIGVVARVPGRGDYFGVSRRIMTDEKLKKLASAKLEVKE